MIMEDSTETNVIDINKLDNVRPNNDGGWQAACPMCRNEGSDKTGNHLRIYPSMAFSCAKYRADKQHNFGVLTLAGSKSTGEPPSKIFEPKPDMEEIYPDSILSRLTVNYDYWLDRKPHGVSAETMRQFEGGVATTGKMKNRFVFPMRDRNNKIHGFTGRYIFPIPQDKFGNELCGRWKHLGKKENWVWDRFNTIEAVKTTRIATLVEGPGCPLALREAGIHGVIPMFGVVPASALLALLIALNPDKICISLNNEPGNVKAVLNGNEAAERTMRILRNFFAMEKLIKRLPDEKDWLDCTLDQRYAFKKELYG